MIPAAFEYKRAEAVDRASESAELRFERAPVRIVMRNGADGKEHLLDPGSEIDVDFRDEPVELRRMPHPLLPVPALELRFGLRLFDGFSQGHVGSSFDRLGCIC